MRVLMHHLAWAGLALSLSACGQAPLAPSVTQADAVSESAAAQEAQSQAPQSYASAEKLRAEALFLHQEKRYEESVQQQKAQIKAKLQNDIKIARDKQILNLRERKRKAQVQHQGHQNESQFERSSDQCCHQPQRNSKELHPQRTSSMLRIEFSMR